MASKTNDEIPPRVEDCEIGLLSYEPLVGVLRVQTNKGEVELAVNRNTATILAMTLVEFLGAEPTDENEANELN